MYEYKGFVNEIDLRNTLKITLDMGFGVKSKKKFSLNGIRCCDHCVDCSRDSCDLGIVYNRLHDLVLNKFVIIKTYKMKKCGDEIYSADVYINTNRGLVCVNDLLVIENLAEYKD